MPRSTTHRALIAAFICFATLVAPASRAEVARASDWLGRAVVTADGQEVGTVRDLAFDANGRIAYAVVSVGSFLIENNLIAVAPDALVPSPNDDGYLRLAADPDSLRQATRFATDGRWPARPDVVRSAGAPTIATQPAAPKPAAANGAAEPATSGTATITSPTRTAHLSASERYISENPAERPAIEAATAKKTASAHAGAMPPLTPKSDATPFERLDRDGDGVLNRSEFAHQMSPKDSYSRIDHNANGVIDPDEFEAFEQAAEPAR